MPKNRFRFVKGEVFDLQAVVDASEDEATTVLTEQQAFSFVTQIFPADDGKVPPGDPFAADLATSQRRREFDPEMRRSLGAVVRCKVPRESSTTVPDRAEQRRIIRERIAPMLDSYFAVDERPVVRDFAIESVVLLDRTTTLRLIEEVDQNIVAWKIANIYLNAEGGQGTGDESAGIGASHYAGEIYVPVNALVDLRPFEDLIVHEVAHLFSETLRDEIGLPEMGSGPFLLPTIQSRLYETFAYACAAYYDILDGSKTRADRLQQLEDYEQQARTLNAFPPAAYVDRDEYLDILAEAASAENGWMRILERCAVPAGEEPDDPLLKLVCGLDLVNQEGKGK